MGDDQTEIRERAFLPIAVATEQHRVDLLTCFGIAPPKTLEGQKSLGGGSSLFRLKAELR
jgi:hypothetical protein